MPVDDASFARLLEPAIRHRKRFRLIREYQRSPADTQPPAHPVSEAERQEFRELREARPKTAERVRAKCGARVGRRD